MKKAIHTPDCLKSGALCARLLICLGFVLSIPAAGRASQTGSETQPLRMYLPILTRPPGYVESSGILDARFDGDGRVITDLTQTDDEGLSLAIQPDGKLLVGGEVDSGLMLEIDLAVARYNRDGSLDTTFGDGGWVRTDLDGADDSASDLTLQSDGKILQSGSSRDDFALVRYNPDGSLDTTFGDGVGWVRTDIGSFADESKAIAVQSDGKILVGGYALNGSYYDFALVRYNADGSLDTSFDEDGIVTTYLTADNDQGQALVLLADGRIILAGSVQRASPFFHDFALVCYLPVGTLDPSFGSNGRVITDINGGRDFAYAVTLQADGKILVAGRAQDGPTGDIDFALVRYSATGGLDTTFSGDGKVTTDFTGGEDRAYAITVQPDGKVIIAGYAFMGSGFDFALARYLTNGNLDPTFGTGGKLVTDFMAGDDLGLAVVLQLDGKIVVAGNAFNGIDVDFALARYK